MSWWGMRRVSTVTKFDSEESARGYLHCLSKFLLGRVEIPGMFMLLHQRLKPNYLF
jgi:hypothetical protein